MFLFFKKGHSKSQITNNFICVISKLLLYYSNMTYLWFIWGWVMKRGRISITENKWRKVRTPLFENIRDDNESTTLVEKSNFIPAGLIKANERGSNILSGI